MTEELGEAIARAEQCYDDAKYLLDGHRYEAAVNRAYYSMFTAVQGLLLSKDIFVKTHAGAKTKFHELFLKTNLLPLEFGKLLEKARRHREEKRSLLVFYFASLSASGG